MLYKHFVTAGLGVLGTAACAQAAVLPYNSPDVASNAATRSSWLSAAGITVPDYLVDFESGFSANQNIAGVALAGGLTLNSGAAVPTVTIVSGPGSVGGSNPIGSFAAMHAETSSLRFDFASPVDYVGFYDIDQTGGTVTVTFVGGGTVPLAIDGTLISGNSAEFYGIYRNDQPAITGLSFSVGGSGGWGVDNIEFGVVPEPVGMVVALGGAAMMTLRRRRTAGLGI
jgi:hypothetical protein